MLGGKASRWFKSNHRRKVTFGVIANIPPLMRRCWLKSNNVIQFCLVDRVVIPIAVRSKEWRYLKRSVSSVFAAAYQISLADPSCLCLQGVVSEVQRDESENHAHFGGYSFTKRRCQQSSTAMGDNAMCPETTFNP